MSGIIAGLLDMVPSAVDSIKADWRMLNAEKFL